MSSETYRYKCGAAQTFCQSENVFEPGLYGDSELSYSADSEVYPIVVVCTAEEGDGELHGAVVSNGWSRTRLSAVSVV